MLVCFNVKSCVEIDSVRSFSSVRFTATNGSASEQKSKVIGPKYKVRFTL